MSTRPAVAWSHSAIEMFENCPRKYWAVKIGKVVSDDNANNIQGDDEHKLLEKSLKTGKPLGKETVRIDLMGNTAVIDMSNMNPTLDRLRAAPGEKFYEYQMTLDQQFVPCGWKDWNKAWVRVASDLLIVNQSLATYIDWKSGKFRKSDEQIETAALLVFRHFPHVQTMKGGLYYYRQNKIHARVVHRAEEPALWQDRMRRVKAIEQAKATDNWPATPNPLCAWCPYAGCPSNTNPKVK